jgi:hypothetical protein
MRSRAAPGPRTFRRLLLKSCATPAARLAHAELFAPGEPFLRREGRQDISIIVAARVLKTMGRSGPDEDRATRGVMHLGRDLRVGPPGGVHRLENRVNRLAGQRVTRDSRPWMRSAPTCAGHLLDRRIGNTALPDCR